jgi:Raf kinase inhibitor-like YbhB/YbcL family protein
MKIISSAFSDNSNLPEKFTCLGENINPPLEIQEVPNNTQSLILLVEDIDAQEESWVHWLLFNIPPDELKIKENSIPYKAVQVLTSSKNFDYDGPCPKTFDGPHRIHFKAMALDVTLDLTKESDKEMVLEAAQGHIIKEAELVSICSLTG